MNGLVIVVAALASFAIVTRAATVRFQARYAHLLAPAVQPAILEDMTQTLYHITLMDTDGRKVTEARSDVPGRFVHLVTDSQMRAMPVMSDEPTFEPEDATMHVLTFARVAKAVWLPEELAEQAGLDDRSALYVRVQA